MTATVFEIYLHIPLSMGGCLFLEIIKHECGLLLAKSIVTEKSFTVTFLINTLKVSSVMKYYAHYKPKHLIKSWNTWSAVHDILRQDTWHNLVKDSCSQHRGREWSLLMLGYSVLLVLSLQHWISATKLHTLKFYNYSFFSTTSATISLLYITSIVSISTFLWNFHANIFFYGYTSSFQYCILYTYLLYTVQQVCCTLFTVFLLLLIKEAGCSEQRIGSITCVWCRGGDKSRHHQFTASTTTPTTSITIHCV